MRLIGYKKAWLFSILTEVNTNHWRIAFRFGTSGRFHIEFHLEILCAYITISMRIKQNKSLTYDR